MIGESLYTCECRRRVNNKTHRICIILCILNINIIIIIQVNKSRDHDPFEGFYCSLVAELG